MPETLWKAKMPVALVTGADGFIGSHLVEFLVKQGYTVRAMAQYNSFGTAGWLDTSPVRDHVDVIPGDVRDAQVCERATQGVDTVFHLAALIAIPYSYLAPMSYVETNVIGTLNMCQAALRNSVGRFLQMSTSEVYGTAQSVPISEDHPIQPQSPYAASKVGSDAIARSFQASFGLPLCVARPFNTYGPRQSRRAFIPSVGAQVVAGVDAIRIGDTRPTRDLTYVKDTAEALGWLAERGPIDGSVVNIGSGTEHSVADVVALIQEVAGTDIPLTVSEDRLRPPDSEVFRLVCDNRRLIELTGFSPRVGLREGIQQTLDWLASSQTARSGNVTSYAV